MGHHGKKTHSCKIIPENGKFHQKHWKIMPKNGNMEDSVPASAQQGRVRPEVAPAPGGCNTMGKPWNTMGKQWEKQWENHGKPIGKLWGNHGKTMENHRETMEKQWKTMENHGKPWENHGKTMGKQ